MALVIGSYNFGIRPQFASVQDEALVGGYLRIGSLTTPTNTTDGDLTVSRVMIGDEDTFSSDRVFQVRYGTEVVPAAGGFIGGSVNAMVAPDGTSGAAVGFFAQLVVRPTAGSSALHQAMKFEIVHDSGSFDLTGTAFAGIQGNAIQNVAGTVMAEAQGVRGFVRAQAGEITTARAFDARLGQSGDAGEFGTIVGFDVADADAPSGGVGTAIGFRVNTNLGAMSPTGDAIALDIVAQSGAAGLNLGIRNAGALLQSGTSQFTAALNLDAQVNLSAELVFDAASVISTISKSRQAAGDQLFDFDVDGLSASEDARFRVFRNTTTAGGDDRFTVYVPGTSTVAMELFANSKKMLLGGEIEIDGNLNHDGTGVGFYGTAPAAKPTVTGSRGGNAALASLLTALAGLGLLTDSSSA